MNTHPTRMRDVRHGQIRRLEIPVTRAPQNGFDPIGTHGGPFLVSRLVVDEIGLEPGFVGDGFHTFEFFDSFVTKGDA